MGSRKRAVLRTAMAALAVILLSAFAAACGGDDENTSGGGGEAAQSGPTKVNVGFVPVTPSLPITIAIEEGIFEKNGLDVTFTKTLSATNQAIGRQFDIGQSTAPDFLTSVEGGLDHVLISNMITEGETTTALMASKKSGITKIEDLEGKTFGVPSRASGIAQSVLYLLREAGVDTDTVKIQEMPFPTMPDQLKAGRVDAVAPVEPFASQIRAAGGATEIVNPLVAAFQKAGETEDRGGVLFATASREWAEQNPEAVEAWRKSIEEAGEFMKTNEEQSRKYLAQHADIPPEAAAHAPFYETNSSPVTPEEIGAWIEVMRGSGMIKNPDDLKPEDLVYNAG